MKLRTFCPLTLDDDELDRICEAAVRIARRVPLRLGGASEGGRGNNYTDQMLEALRAQPFLAKNTAMEKEQGLFIDPGIISRPGPRITPAPSTGRCWPASAASSWHPNSITMPFAMPTCSSRSNAITSGTRDRPTCSPSSTGGARPGPRRAGTKKRAVSASRAGRSTSIEKLHAAS